MDTLFGIMRTLHETNTELLDELIERAISSGKVRAKEKGEQYAVYMTVHAPKPKIGKDLVQFTWGICVTSIDKPFKDPFQAGMWGLAGTPTPSEMQEFLKHRDSMGLKLSFPVIGDSHYPHIGHVEGTEGVAWASYHNCLQALKKWKNAWVDVTTLTHLYTIHPTGIRPTRPKGITK